jgi:hypothetical protein
METYCCGIMSPRDEEDWASECAIHTIFLDSPKSSNARTKRHLQLNNCFYPSFHTGNHYTLRIMKVISLNPFPNILQITTSIVAQTSPTLARDIA